MGKDECDMVEHLPLKQLQTIVVGRVSDSVTRQFGAVIINVVGLRYLALLNKLTRPTWDGKYIMDKEGCDKVELSALKQLHALEIYAEYSSVVGRVSDSVTRHFGTVIINVVGLRYLALLNKLTRPT